MTLHDKPHRRYTNKGLNTRLARRLSVQSYKQLEKQRQVSRVPGKKKNLTSLILDMKHVVISFILMHTRAEDNTVDPRFVRPP